MTTLERAWRGGRNEWRTHLVSALCSAVAFLCLVFSLIALVNLQGLQQRWENTNRLSIYLTQTATEADVAELTRALEGTSFVEAARFLSSEAARQEMAGQADGNLFEALPVEAFPASIEVTLGSRAEEAQRTTLLSTLEQLTAVESVETYAAWTSRIARLVGAAVFATLLLSLVVSLAVVAVIASAIQLALQRRRKELEVLKIVGATHDYVRRPFLLEGAAQGGLGALIALAVGAILFSMLARNFDQHLGLLLGSSPSFLPWQFSGFLVGLGMLLGGLAAAFGLRRPMP